MEVSRLCTGCVRWTMCARGTMPNVARPPLSCRPHPPAHGRHNRDASLASSRHPAAARCQTRRAPAAAVWAGSSYTGLVSLSLAVAATPGLALHCPRILRGYPTLVDHPYSWRRRRSSAKHGSPSNSRRSAPITMSRAVAVDVPADTGKHDSS